MLSANFTQNLNSPMWKRNPWKKIKIRQCISFLLRKKKEQYIYFFYYRIQPCLTVNTLLPGNIHISLTSLWENCMASWRKLFFYWIFQSSWGKIGKRFSLTFPKEKKKYVLHKENYSILSLFYKEKDRQRSKWNMQGEKGSTFPPLAFIFFLFSVGRVAKSRQEMDSCGFILRPTRLCCRVVLAMTDAEEKPNRQSSISPLYRRSID